MQFGRAVWPAHWWGLFSPSLTHSVSSLSILLPFSLILSIIECPSSSSCLPPSPRLCRSFNTSIQPLQTAAPASVPPLRLDPCKTWHFDGGHRSNKESEGAERQIVWQQANTRGAASTVGKEELLCESGLSCRSWPGESDLGTLENNLVMAVGGCWEACGETI